MGGLLGGAGGGGGEANRKEEADVKEESGKASELSRRWISSVC